MNKRLIFASANPNKVIEVECKLGGNIPVGGLSDIDCFIDIPETADTLEGNAQMKARFIWENYGCDCFADDTGLEVFALGNAPGVKSARYAGDQKDTEANMRKLLSELEGKSDRTARFRTVICLILGGEEFLFEGIATGNILTARRGSEGFGYDPIFIPDGCNKTFAEMSMDEKNKLSHRGKAIEKLASFLSARELPRDE